MVTRYKKYKNDPTIGSPEAIQRILDDGTISCIPMVEDNRDYQEYLEWAKTNTIEDAD